MCCKMKYNIGIVGAGIVGNAVKYGMEILGHNVYVHDIKYDTKLEQLLNTEICLVAYIDWGIGCE